MSVVGHTAKTLHIYDLQILWVYFFKKEGCEPFFTSLFPLDRLKACIKSYTAK